MFTHEMIKSFNQLEMDVYNYIISNEEKVVYMKVRELAEEVHVSTTTILRFCKKVGCEGYSEFRFHLLLMIRSRQYFVEKVREQLQSHCLYQERRNRH